jgi:hypothetical protein
MFSNNKKKCFLNNQTKNQPLSEKLIESLHVKEPEQIKKPIQSNNKLISCYEEDYTRNNTEIMKLWQRN